MSWKDRQVIRADSHRETLSSRSIFETEDPRGSVLPHWHRKRNNLSAETLSCRNVASRHATNGVPPYLLTV